MVVVLVKPLRDQLLDLILDTTKDDYMECISGDCVEGTVEDVAKQSITVASLYSPEDYDSSSIVIGFGKNWVQHQYRWRYRTNKDEPFKIVPGNL